MNISSNGKHRTHFGLISRHLKMLKCSTDMHRFLKFYKSQSVVSEILGVTLVGINEYCSAPLELISVILKMLKPSGDIDNSPKTDQYQNIRSPEL